MNAHQVGRPDHARELRYALTDAIDVCDRLGLLSRGKFTRQASGVMICCPWHEDRTPSCSVRRATDGTIAVKCWGCGATGDVLSLVAAAQGLDVRLEFRKVLQAAASIAGLRDVIDEIESGETTQQRRVLAPPPTEPERSYPPSDEIDRLWSHSIPVTDDRECASWLEKRSLDPEVIAANDLARVIEPTAGLPRWASYRRMAWTATGHRLIVAMKDHEGIVRSVRAARIIDGDSPKRLPPGGHRASSLAMADELATAMLARSIQPRRLVVVEGEPDFLVWATRTSGGPATAVLGIVGGTWNDSFASRVPQGIEVVIRTDHDDSGNKYASAVWSTLKSKCFVRRGGRA